MYLPFWLAIIVFVLAAIPILERICIPSVRWMLQRKINRVIDEINTRLDIQIKPFQLTKRQVLIDRLIFDANVQQGIRDYARENSIALDSAQKQAVNFAQEIVPAFNAFVYFRLGYWFAKKIARLLYRIRVNFSDHHHLGQIDANATVVFVVNHRSNMDYILVAFLAAEKTALSYAVGEWARIWPLQSIIRAMGAFFVRRNSGNPLYRKVLERYVHMATQEGVCQAVFLEGGLSRDGRLRSPKLGILDYMVRNFDLNNSKEIVFIPVGLNYDRTLEDRTLLRSLDPDQVPATTRFMIKTSLKFIWQNVRLVLSNKWQRFGFACVHFGEPIPLREYCEKNALNFLKMSKESRFNAIQNLADELLHRIRHSIPVLPIAISCHIFINNNGLSQLQFMAEAYALIRHLQARGAIIGFPQTTQALHMQSALNMLILRRVITEMDGLLFYAESNLDLLRYYANSIHPLLSHST